MEKKVSIYLRPESINIKWRLKLKWTKKHCPDFSRYSYCSSFMILETQQVHFPSRDRKFSYTIYKKKVQTGMKNLTHSFAIRMYIRMNEYRRWKNRQISVEKVWLNEYRISSYSFRGNYSFLDLEIQRSQYIRPKLTVYKGAETIQARKLFKGGNYMRKYGIYIF